MQLCSPLTDIEHFDVNGSWLSHSNQNTMQYLASTSAFARKCRHKNDTQDQTHAVRTAWRTNHRRRRKEIGEDERGYTTEV